MYNLIYINQQSMEMWKVLVDFVLFIYSECLNSAAWIFVMFLGVYLSVRLPVRLSVFLLTKYLSISSINFIFRRTQRGIE